MNLQQVFDTARSENRAALIGYLPAGYPDMQTCIGAVQAMVAGGCDVIEVGVPFSDPVLDGPVIENAARYALAQGIRIPQVLEIVSAVADCGAAPVVMSYINPIARYGMERFAADLRASGGCALITPDLIVDEAEQWIPCARNNDIDTIFLVAPLSTDARIEYTVDHTRGFVYAASVMGVTGVRDGILPSAEQLVTRIRQYTQLPICVGLGVKDGQQAAAIAQYADGVIVGSAFVSAVTSSLADVKHLAQELLHGVKLKHSVY